MTTKLETLTAEKRQRRDEVLAGIKEAVAWLETHDDLPVWYCAIHLGQLDTAVAERLASTDGGTLAIRHYGTTVDVRREIAPNVSVIAGCLVADVSVNETRWTHPVLRPTEGGDK